MQITALFCQKGSLYKLALDFLSNISSTGLSHLNTVVGLTISSALFVISTVNFESGDGIVHAKLIKELLQKNSSILIITSDYWILL